MEDDHRANAAQELRFMRALRLAIPASLDSKASSDYSDREAELIALVNGETPAAGT